MIENNKSNPFFSHIKNWDIKKSLSKESINIKPCQSHNKEKNIYCFDCNFSYCKECDAKGKCNPHENHKTIEKTSKIMKKDYEIMRKIYKVTEETIKTHSLEDISSIYNTQLGLIDSYYKSLHDHIENMRNNEINELKKEFDHINKILNTLNTDFFLFDEAVVKFTNYKRLFHIKNPSEVQFLQEFNMINKGILGIDNFNNVVSLIDSRLDFISNENKQKRTYVEKVISDYEKIMILSKDNENHRIDWNDLNSKRFFNEFITQINSEYEFLSQFETYINSQLDNEKHEENSKHKKTDIYLNNNSNLNNSQSRNRTDSLKISKTSSMIRPKTINKEKNFIFENLIKQMENISIVKTYEILYYNYIKHENLNPLSSSSMKNIIQYNNLLNKSYTSNFVNNLSQGKGKVNHKIKNDKQVYLSKNIIDLLINKNDKNNKNNYEMNIINTVINEEYSFSLPSNDTSLVFQVIPNTKKIQLYDFLSKKPYIIKINSLNDKDHSYNLFPYGSKTIYIDNIIYIIGGKDVYKEYNTILQYDIQLSKIDYIGKLNYERSYFSILHNNKTGLIYIIGGENNSTCEVFNYIDNIIYTLPNLNTTRCNSTLIQYNDYIYSFFGYAHSIIDNKLCASIEKLNISQIFKKTLMNNENELSYWSSTLSSPCEWERVNIKNSPSIDLHFEIVSLIPFTNTHVFIHGGYDFRKVNRSIYIYDFNTDFIFDLNGKEYGELKESVVIDE